ncbi:hypothetical protein PHLGIDRAFT_117647 [Phlebiopsis gigantea 11061_1 CR5-6]|uniref:GBD/FH3 domain-containing protein n=1 Tax=Phlebiopsis gigantea (strain 11061_1 CR5-6) TaxID=745531 RepID=A0A0C3S948_PHLG1|nr:hypothetical protein PHLGIDRAFT_117647 [Phlebiopsis gigantea 11061_1 CR5-6]
MVSPGAGKDRLTADDFIAFGSDSLDDTSCLAQSSSTDSVDNVHSGDSIQESPSQTLRRNGRLRQTEQKTLGTPQWFIKKIQDRTASRKQMSELQAALQGRDSDWVQQFVHAGGMAALAYRLYSLSRKSSPRQDDIHAEYEVARCISHILNHHAPATRAALARNPQELVTHIASAVGILHLPTRVLVLHILVFFIYCQDFSVYRLVINGLEALSEDNDSPGGCYSFWFSTFLSLVSGRGKMGSPVGASPNFRRSGATTEDTFSEYLISNIWLINGILDAMEDDLHLRLHHRSLMEASGLQAILEITQSLDIPSVNNQLVRLQEKLDEDAQDLGESLARDSSIDLSDPEDVFKALCEQVNESKARDHLLSILQHLLLVRRDDQRIVHHFQVIDTVITDLVMDKKLGGAEKRLGLSVERVVGQLEQIDKAKALEDDLIKSCSTILQLKAENQDLEERLAHSDTLASSLRDEISRLHAQLSRNSRYLESPLPIKPAGIDVTLKENIPLTPQQSPGQSAIPRLNFRGFSSWFTTPQSSPAGSPAMTARRSPLPGAAFHDGGNSLAGKC